MLTSPMLRGYLVPKEDKTHFKIDIKIMYPSNKMQLMCSIDRDNKDLRISYRPGLGDVLLCGVSGESGDEDVCE